LVALENRLIIIPAAELLLYLLVLFMAIILTFKLPYSNWILSLCMRGAQSYLSSFLLIRAICAEPLPNGLYRAFNYSFFHFNSPVNTLLLWSCLVSCGLYTKGWRTRRTRCMHTSSRSRGGSRWRHSRTLNKELGIRIGSRYVLAED
jgi:hypothetical protein